MRIESPEADPNIYGNLIFDESGIPNQWEKRWVVFLLLSCLSSFYILVLVFGAYQIYGLQIFYSHSVSCLLTLALDTFAIQKLFSLMQSHLFIFYFGACVLSVITKKSLPRPLPRSSIPIFSSRSFMISGLTFKFLVHFELICVSGVMSRSSFILLHVNIQLSQHHLLKRLSFLHQVFLAPLL